MRWIEQGIYWPRFSIHSWNGDGSASARRGCIPEILGAVRGALNWRERLVPLLYTLLWRAHVRHEPLLRPLFHDFPGQAGSYEEHGQFMLGPGLLVAPVVEQGALSGAFGCPKQKAAGIASAPASISLAARPELPPRLAPRPPSCARARSCRWGHRHPGPKGRLPCGFSRSLAGRRRPNSSTTMAKATWIAPTRRAGCTSPPMAGAGGTPNRGNLRRAHNARGRTSALRMRQAALRRHARQ